MSRFVLLTFNFLCPLLSEASGAEGGRVRAGGGVLPARWSWCISKRPPGGEAGPGEACDPALADT